MSRPARRTRTGGLAAVLAGALTLAQTPAVAKVSVDQSYPVPSSGTFTIRGHGYGHGRGMSQYGAYGAARQGLGYRRILGFYYPGTSSSTVTGKLRVLITHDTTTGLVVSAAPGLHVRDLGTRTRYDLPRIRGASRWRLAVAGGRTLVEYYTKRWRRYRPGGRDFLVGDGQFGADVPLRLWTPGGGRTYRGYLRAVSPAPGSSTRDTVNLVSLDSYVKGVLPAEMPASWSAEALKAQAVAARTYATWAREANVDHPYQICDTSACQVYNGVGVEDARTNAAVEATRGQILTYGGAAAFTQFSASSGGWTSAGTRPYLVAKPDPYDDAAGNPVHDWSVKLAAARIIDAYPSLGRLKRLRVTRREGNGQWGGRVVAIILDGTRRDISLSGDTFAGRFGLRTSWFAG